MEKKSEQRTEPKGTEFVKSPELFEAFPITQLTALATALKQEPLLYSGLESGAPQNSHTLEVNEDICDVDDYDCA